MNELQTFISSEFGTVRGCSINNIPYLVAKDVANLLGYAKPMIKLLLKH